MATLKDTCNPAPTDQQALPHFVLADHEKFPMSPSNPDTFAVIVQTERYRLADDSWLALEEGDGLVFRSNLPPGTVGGEGVLGFYETAVCVKVFALRFSFLGKFLLLLLLLFVLWRFSRLIPLGLLYALEESREGLGA